jgi:tetratricopeptide (TPR) repeat protein
MNMDWIAATKNRLPRRGADCQSASNRQAADLPDNSSLALRVSILFGQRTHIFLAALIFSLAGSVCRGGQPATQPGASASSLGTAIAASSGQAIVPEAVIDRAIADLASSDYNVRERASQTLWNAGAASVPALEKVDRDSDDFEAVHRARQILQSFELGIAPGTPAETVAIIVRFHTSNYQGKLNLAQRLRTDGKVDLALQLIAKERNPSVREQLTNDFSETGYARESLIRSRGLRRMADPAQVALMTRNMLAQGDADRAERYLASMLSGEGKDILLRDYAALLLSRGKLDAAIAQLRVNLKPADEDLQRRLAWMLRAKGDLAGAVAAAKLVNDNALVEDLQVELADWKDLAKIDAKTDADALANMPGGTEKLARIIAFRNLAGETKACDLAVAAAVRALEGAERRDRTLIGALILSDRAAEVIELSKTDDVRVAFGLLVAQSRLKEAFGIIKIDLPIPAKVDWPAWLKDGRNEVGPERLFLAHQVVRALHMAGEEEHARDLIAAIVTAYGAKLLDVNREVLALNLLESEIRFVHPEAADALAAKLLALELKDPDGVISSLYRDQETIAEMVWKALREQFPKEDRPAALARLRRLLAEKPDKAAIAEVVGLVPRIEPLFDAPIAELTPDDDPANPRAVKVLALATLLHHCGESKLALKYLARVPATGVSAEVLIDQGNLYAEEKAWTEAIKSYAAAFAKDRKSASALYLQGWAETKRGADATAVKSPTAENDVAAGLKRMATALLIPLGDGESRLDLAKTLARLHKDDEAARQRAWVPRAAAPHDRSIIRALMETGDLAAEKGDDANMASLWQRVGVELISGSVVFSEPRYYLQPAASAHSARARELLRAGKTAEGIEEIHKAEAVEPANLQLALDCDADLRRHGAAGEADALYRRMLQQHETFCRDFPRSGTYHNDLAWLAANLDRDLDKALAHAQRAVELEPKTASVLDTLAEVQFRRGNKAEALRLAKRCLEMEPDGEHYKRQLARFIK